MLNEEEKEAIETIEFLKKKRWYKYAGDDGTEILDEDEKKDVDIVLNLIDKLQKEIEEYQKCFEDIVREQKKQMQMQKELWKRLKGE